MMCKVSSGEGNAVSGIGVGVPGKGRFSYQPGPGRLGWGRS